MSHTVETQLQIDAPAERVWQILTDFAEFTEWNPMIPSIQGEAKLGGKLKIAVKIGRAPLATFATRLITFEPQRALCWRGGSTIASGEHGFYIEPLPAGGVHFVHREKFRGIAIPLLFPLLHGKLRRSFQAMDQALKARAET